MSSSSVIVSRYMGYFYLKKTGEKTDIDLEVPFRGVDVR